MTTTDPADERMRDLAYQRAEDRRQALADLTREAVNAGTYGEPSPEMAAEPEPPMPPQAWLKESSTETIAAKAVGWQEGWKAGYAAARAPEAPGDAHGPTPDVGAAQGGDGGSADESEPRVHYEVEMYNDGWSIPIYRTHSVDDARAHEEPAVTSASTRIVRVTREVIQ